MLTVREARVALPAVLQTFRTLGAAATPIVVGAQRRPEGVLMSAALFELAAEDVNMPTLDVTQARKGLSSALHSFRMEGAEASPVAIGAHAGRGNRKPEGVLLSIEQYALIADEVDRVLTGFEVASRLAASDAGVGLMTLTVDELAERVGLDPGFLDQGSREFSAGSLEQGDGPGEEPV
ncbi:hypothetical protein GCM10010411_76180 [Actinomadura fulvescens]|uniref:CBS domain-containing protein n=1 Tax=Actinomadura fulvescens TaxID=46160 RepID=A0ABN3QJ25_9ACTN